MNGRFGPRKSGAWLLLLSAVTLPALVTFFFLRSSSAYNYQTGAPNHCTYQVLRANLDPTKCPDFVSRVQAPMGGSLGGSVICLPCYQGTCEPYQIRMPEVGSEYIEYAIRCASSNGTDNPMGLCFIVLSRVGDENSCGVCISDKQQSAWF